MNQATEYMHPLIKQKMEVRIHRVTVTLQPEQELEEITRDRKTQGKDKELGKST